MELRCVNCGARVRRLLVQYSPGNIRLMKCESCKAVADPYVECEFMILLIDLILHKQKAYRHLLFNMLNQDTVNLEGIFWKMLLEVFLRNFVFFGFLFLATKIFLNKQNSSLDTAGFKVIILAILLSSYFKVFLIAMMVWDFPSSVIFILDIFVISSNVVALKVLTKLPTASCIGVLVGVHGAKFFVSSWLQILLSMFSYVILGGDQI